MARPKKAIDEKKVLAEARRFSTYEEIAEAVGCSVDTLSRRFADVIEKGHTHARRSLRGKQFDLAMNGHTGMLVWLGKQYLGQTDRADHRHEHKVDYGVMRVAESPDVTDWEALAKQQQAVMGGGGNGRKTAN